jgi:hypothetical protein
MSLIYTSGDGEKIMKPAIQVFFDEQTFTITYLVSDPATRRAVIIDPVLDYDPKKARTATHSADRVLDAVAGSPTPVRSHHRWAAPPPRRALKTFSSATELTVRPT